VTALITREPDYAVRALRELADGKKNTVNFFDLLSLSVGVINPRKATKFLSGKTGTTTASSASGTTRWRG
jgi:hypothetical protein